MLFTWPIGLLKILLKKGIVELRFYAWLNSIYIYIFNLPATCKIYLPTLAPMSNSVSRPISFGQMEAKLFSQPWKTSNLILVVQGRRFHVHKEVLIVCSPVFEAMLSSDFKEKSLEEIPLPGKMEDETEQLLEAIYPDRKVSVTKENCFPLLRLSTEYQMAQLKADCENYVNAWCKKDMTKDEAIEVVILSQTYPLGEQTVQGCMKRFVSDENVGWGNLQKHRMFSDLNPKNLQQITEERVKYLESAHSKWPQRDDSRSRSDKWF